MADIVANAGEAKVACLQDVHFVAVAAGGEFALNAEVTAMVVAAGEEAIHSEARSSFDAVKCKPRGPKVSWGQRDCEGASGEVTGTDCNVVGSTDTGP